MNDPICRFNDSRANAINCTQFVYETTDVQKQPQCARSHLIGLVAAGGGTLSVDGASAPLAAGDVYCIRRGSWFSVARGEGMAYYYISFSGWHADELVERLGVSRERFVFRGSESLCGVWADCFARAEAGNLDLYSEAALLYAAAAYAEAPPKKNALADTIAEYVNSHYQKTDLSMAQIAGRLGYDPKYLSAVFRRGCGVPFSKYLRGIRIRHAAFLFEQGVESVKSVARLSGFADALYFSKVFKEETGVTPTEYVAGHRGAEGPLGARDAMGGPF